MDDLAPAPAQRTSDDGGRRPEENIAARKRAVKKVQSIPAKEQGPEPEPETDHQLDILA
jgi:hypothetical protein